jgi:CheY-like chemotaxis protein
MSAKRPTPKYSTVMLIDDSEIDNFINHKMIEGCNFSERTYIHTSSKSALEFLRNLERTGKVPKELIPEVIFLDINMPIMDGFQFIEEFDKLTKDFKTRTKIVMLTTSVNPTDIERSQKNKYIIKYINKPLTQEMLSTL